MNDSQHPPSPSRRPMALVDHYAGRALVGLLSGPKGSAKPEELARQAFDFAHAMCRERAMRIDRSRQGHRDTDPAPPPAARHEDPKEDAA